jgi:hypothetical protein
MVYAFWDEGGARSGTQRACAPCPFRALTYMGDHTPHSCCFPTRHAPRVTRSHSTELASFVQ